MFAGGVFGWRRTGSRFATNRREINQLWITSNTYSQFWKRQPGSKTRFEGCISNNSPARQASVDVEAWGQAVLNIQKWNGGSDGTHGSLYGHHNCGVVVSCSLHIPEKLRLERWKHTIVHGRKNPTSPPPNPLGLFKKELKTTLSKRCDCTAHPKNECLPALSCTQMGWNLQMKPGLV